LSHQPIISAVCCYGCGTEVCYLLPNPGTCNTYDKESFNQPIICAVCRSGYRALIRKQYLFRHLPFSHLRPLFAPLVVSGPCDGSLAMLNLALTIFARGQLPSTSSSFTGLVVAVIARYYLSASLFACGAVYFHPPIIFLHGRLSLANPARSKLLLMSFGCGSVICRQFYHNRCCAPIYLGSCRQRYQFRITSWAFVCLEYDASG